MSIKLVFIKVFVVCTLKYRKNERRKMNEGNLENNYLGKKKLFTKIEAIEFFRKKIKNSIYIITGCHVVDERVVLLLEEQLKIYLKSILLKAFQFTQQRKKYKSVNCQDLYNALSGTPEYYGAKRHMITKELCRKTNKYGNDENFEEINDVDMDTTDETQDILEAELRLLNDNSDAYYKSERHAQKFKRLFADLTSIMDKDEYLAYSDKKSKFISKRPLFYLWIDWAKNIVDDAFIILGFLCVNKLQRLVQRALNKRERLRTNSLFQRDSITFNKEEPIDFKYFLDNDDFLKYEEDYYRQIFKNINLKYSDGIEHERSGSIYGIYCKTRKRKPYFLDMIIQARLVSLCKIQPKLYSDPLQFFPYLPVYCPKSKNILNQNSNLHIPTSHKKHNIEEEINELIGYSIT